MCLNAHQMVATNAWLTVNMQCNAYGESPEEAVQNLQNIMNEMIDEMYMVEEFI